MHSARIFPAKESLHASSRKIRHAFQKNRVTESDKNWEDLVENYLIFPSYFLTYTLKWNQHCNYNRMLKKKKTKQANENEVKKD